MTLELTYEHRDTQKENRAGDVQCVSEIDYADLMRFMMSDTPLLVI